MRLRRGAVYRIDTNFRVVEGASGGLRLSTGQTLQFNGAELKALPSPHPGGSVIQAVKVHGWKIAGPGRVTGERDIHRGRTGEWGFGISAWSSSNWSIAGGIEINNCWGDGLYIGPFPPPGSFCDNFVVDGVHIWNCRRNGISVTGGRSGQIISPHIHKIYGTNPGGGIDLEPDFAEHPNRNIRILGGRIYDTAAGIYISAANRDVVVAGMQLIEGANSGMIFGNNAQRIVVRDNLNIRSTVGGEEGAAIRTAVEVPSSLREVEFRNNLLSGGGQFVIDCVGSDYGGVTFAGNRLRADNPRVQGIARLGRVTFTDNDCLLGPAAGKQGDYFLYMALTTHGRNVYRNNSRFSMHSVLVHSRDLGGDRYVGPRLGRLYEPPLSR